jgi:hypothetical protein
MSRFAVAPDTLMTSAGAARRVGDGLGALVGSAAGMGAAEGLPHATAAAFGAFADQAGRHVAALSDSVGSLGACTAAAAALYTQTDDDAMR